MKYFCRRSSTKVSLELPSPPLPQGDSNWNVGTAITNCLKQTNVLLLLKV